MTERSRRWPSIEQVIEQAERGIIDETMDAVPPFGLEDWEIRGEPEPAEAARAGDTRSVGGGARGRETPESQGTACADAPSAVGDTSSTVSPRSMR